MQGDHIEGCLGLGQRWRKMSSKVDEFLGELDAVCERTGRPEGSIECNTWEGSPIAKA